MANIIHFTEIIEQEIIGIQITFEHNTETKETKPVGLMLYSYPSQCFMVMTHKMHGVFFRTIIDNTLASIDIEQRIKDNTAKPFVLPERDIEHGDLMLEQMQDEATHISNHFEKELLFNH